MRINLNPRAFSMYDAARQEWVSPPGEYQILAGDSDRNLPLRAGVSIGP